MLRDLIVDSHFAYIAVIKAITEVDDTVLVLKKILPPLMDMLPDFDKIPKLSNIFASLLSPRNNNFNCLGKY